MSLRPNQFRFEFPDGLALERLPVGLAAGTLYVPYVATGIEWKSLARNEPWWLSRELDARLRVVGVGAELRASGGGGGGGDRAQNYTYEFRGIDQGSLDESQLEALQITYSFQGDLLAEEEIDLR